MDCTEELRDRQPCARLDIDLTCANTYMFYRYGIDHWLAWFHYPERIEITSLRLIEK
jgi:hypothetical protein